MGRELKRVSMDFNWPIDTKWDGFLNPLYTAKQCEQCKGSGASPEANLLTDNWYGNARFNPEDRGSKPFTIDNEHILAMAFRNCREVDDGDSLLSVAVTREANRLCDHFNQRWSHHLNSDDVAALVEAGRLRDFTHTWAKGEGFTIKEPKYVPTPEEVNNWSIAGFGHDSINQWVCAKAECKRNGWEYECATCKGHGEIWPSVEAEKAYEEWESYEPPEGDGFQIWETVSEGSPISPVFATPEELAKHMATTRWGADKGTSYESWLKFIKGSGWAPSGVMTSEGYKNGVEAMAELNPNQEKNNVI